MLVVVVVVVCCAGTQTKKIEQENDNSCNTGLHKFAEKEQKSKRHHPKQVLPRTSVKNLSVKQNHSLLNVTALEENKQLVFIFARRPVAVNQP